MTYIVFALSIAFLIIAAVCRGLTLTFKKADHKDKAESLKYAEAEITHYYDQGIKHATPVVKFRVNGVEKKSRASSVNRNEYPVGTIVRIAYKQEWLSDGLGDFVMIDDPKHIADREHVWYGLKFVLLLLAVVFTVAAVILFILGIML